ncbi:MAG: FUSC family protein, partial [Glaciimonas sp.]|nr:FUSC family protein [Glaciimonas sp.]
MSKLIQFIYPCIHSIQAMTTSALIHHNWRSLWTRLKNNISSTLLTQAPALLHMCKMLIAALLAMGLSMLFNLSKPSTAMITVAIVTQPRSGLVLAKGFYRFIGSVVGVAVSLLMVALFPQQPIVFLTVGACWMALCTAGSITFRHFQSYAFVLAGYSLVIVGLPAALNPDQAFDIATTRLSEIMLGLLCAGVVSDIIFPQRLSDVVLATIRKRFANFSIFIQRTESTNPPTSDKNSVVLKLIGEVIALENLRMSSLFESATTQLQSTKLRQLNTAFMTVSTTFHSLDQLFQRLQDDSKDSHKLNILNALLMEYHAIAAIMKNDKISIPFLLQQSRQKLSQRLQALRRGLMQGEINHHQNALLDFDSASELLQRFSDELSIYTRIHNAILPIRPTQGDALPSAYIATNIAPDIPSHYVNRTDPVLVVMSALRGAIGFGLSSFFWIQSGWPSGLDAVVFATVASALFAASPAPIKTVIGFMQGALLGGVLGFVCSYYVEANAQSFTMLCFALAPFILFGAWLTTLPKYAGMGAGMLMFFFSYAAVDNNYTFDFLGFLNNLTGGLIGCGIAVALFM